MKLFLIQLLPNLMLFKIAKIFFARIARLWSWQWTKDFIGDEQHPLARRNFECFGLWTRIYLNGYKMGLNERVHLSQGNTSVRGGFTIIESVLTLVIIATSLTAIFSLQTKVMRSVFGTHDIIEHLIGVRNFIVKSEQEEYYKQGKLFEKKSDDGNYSITYEPKSSKQYPVLSNYKNIVVEKIKLSSKSVFINHDEFVFFRFNPEGKQ